MKKDHHFSTKIFFTALFSFCLTQAALAQRDTTTVNDTTFTKTTALPQKKQNSKAYAKNILKMNVTSLGLKNYHFTLERMLSRKISVSASYRTMPMSPLGNLGLVKTGLEIAGENESGGIADDLSNISAANNTYTLEFRIYGGRKPGAKGFYTGLFGRYGDFRAAYNYDFEGDDGTTYRIPITASARSLSAGLQLGAQFTIAKRLTVDLQLLGGHYGKLTGSAVGDADLSGLSAGEKKDLLQEIEDLSPSLGDKKLFNIKANVGDKGLTADMKGPFAGLRAGIHVGFSF